MSKLPQTFVENVLLIDDEDIDNLINERLLQAASFAKNVKAKNNIPEALSHIYKCLGTGEGIPDIIFLDLHLPQFDGFHFMLEFKQLQYKYDELKDTAIVILSAHINNYQKPLLSMHSFVVDTITKPLADEALEALKLKLHTVKV